VIKAWPFRRLEFRIGALIPRDWLATRCNVRIVELYLGMRLQCLLLCLGFDSALSCRVLVAASGGRSGHSKLAEKALFCATVFLLVAAIA